MFCFVCLFVFISSSLFVLGHFAASCPALAELMTRFWIGVFDLGSDLLHILKGRAKIDVAKEKKKKHNMLYIFYTKDGYPRPPIIKKLV